MFFHVFIVEAVPSVHQTNLNNQRDDVSCLPITQFLLETKKTMANSITKAKRNERRVELFNTEFCWGQFLSTLNVKFQGTLLHDYILQVGIDKVSKFMCVDGKRFCLSECRKLQTLE